MVKISGAGYRFRTLFTLILKDLFVLLINLNHNYKKINKRTFIPTLSTIKRKYETIIVDFNNWTDFMNSFLQTAVILKKTFLLIEISSQMKV